MANQMKQPPMQKQAERLAAQGRFGDTMLVHMNPAEVEGIASLMPGGQENKGKLLKNKPMRSWRNNSLCRIIAQILLEL